MVRRSWWRNIRFHQFAGGSGSVTDYRSDCTFDRHRGGPIAWKKCHDCGSLNICVMFCIASFASIYEWTWRKSELWWRPASLKLSFDLDTFIWCLHVKFLFWTRICHVYRWRNTITKSSYANFDIGKLPAIFIFNSLSTKSRTNSRLHGKCSRLWQFHFWYYSFRVQVSTIFCAGRFSFVVVIVVVRM